MITVSTYSRDVIVLLLDGKISRMSCAPDDLSDEEVELGIVRDSGRGSGLTTPDQDQAFVQQHLRYVRVRLMPFTTVG